ncbi:Mechanosensitive ion channel protein MscS [Chryseobacterium sp. IT-36CA2]
MSVSTVVTFNIVDALDPPVTEDGHRYMPIGNILKSLLLSFVFGAFIFIISVNIQRKNRKR